jgi:dienelactone hydrolase
VLVSAESAVSRPAPWTEPGPYEVAERAVPVWTSAAGEDVAVVARYPIGVTRPLPVVVLCHGLGGEADGYAALGSWLAGHGYAVLHPLFLDALSVAGPALGLAGPDGVDTRWMHDERARGLMHTLLFDPRHWLSRVERVHAVLDSLAGQQHLPVPLRTDGVLVAGHSFGAYTAQLLLGVRLFGVGIDQDLTHPAIAGGVLMSPQGSGDRGLTPRSWDQVRLPLLVITATGDRGANGQGLRWRREPFDASRSTFKHLAVVRDGDHSLGGIGRSARDDAVAGGGTEVRAALCALTTAFAEAVRAGTAQGPADRAAGDWLASGPFGAIIDHEHAALR